MSEENCSEEERRRLLLAARERKMAELQNERCQGGDVLDDKGTAEDISQGTKRPVDRTQSPGPPPKSPRTSSPPTVVALFDEKQAEGQDSAHADVTPGEPMSEACAAPELSPRSRRKSWRRSTRGRASLPALLSTDASQPLCKSISLDLSDEERLEKLMEAAMQVTVKRLRNTLRTIPGADLEAFQSQVDSLQTEWLNAAKTISEENQLSFSSTCSDPAIQQAIDRAKENLNRLQAENLSWESLLNKHRSKSEELAKRVEEAQERGVKLDPSRLAQSSQSELILNKPDYHAVLQRQHRVLNTMELVLESQCMMTTALRAFQEDAELLVKEISSRLAQRAGFQDLPSSPERALLNLPQSAASS